MLLCCYAYLRVSLSSSSTASEQGSLTTIGEFLNVSTLDPLLPTFLITTLCLCVLSVITYYSLVVAWEVFWASRQSPSPLDPSAEVVLTQIMVGSPEEDPRDSWSYCQSGRDCPGYLSDSEVTRTQIMLCANARMGWVHTQKLNQHSSFFIQLS